MRLKQIEGCRDERREKTYAVSLSINGRDRV